MTAVVFNLTSLESGRLLAFGLLAPEARYCTVRHVVANTLQRQFVQPRDWREIATSGNTCRLVRWTMIAVSV
jgi:hypothetical protein